MRKKGDATVDAYTDGSSVPNPGPGGWCALLVQEGRTRLLSGAEAHATNNRMELRAAIEVFRSLTQPACVRLHTDSQYLRLGVTRWVWEWRQLGWRTKAGNKVSNLDLWKELVEVMEPHQVEWDWVQAHSGNVLNERVDRCARKLATEAGRPTSPARLSKIPPGWDLFVWSSAQPSQSAWAYLLQRGSLRRRGQGLLPGATANQLVIRAAIEGLRHSKPWARITLRTNSEYLSRGIGHALETWPRRGWKTVSGRPVENLDLWQELLTLWKSRQVEVIRGSLPEGWKRVVRGNLAARRGGKG